MPKRLVFISNLFPDASAPYRGLDNATVLHWLVREHGWQVETIALRPMLLPTARFTPRSGDEVLRPGFLAVPYVPKFGSHFNHHLIAARLRPVLRKVQERFQPDVLLGAWMFPDACAVAQLGRELAVPSVLLAQGSDLHQYLDMPPRRRAILQATYISHGVITRSRDLALRLQSAGADPARMHPIYNGVDQTVFRPLDRAAAREALGLTQEQKVALFVGNLLPVKDPLLLLDAFAQHVRQTPEKDALLVMVGKGPLCDEITARAAASGISQQVRLTGPLDSRAIAQWMNAADLLCMSSVNEGLPNVILEALNCGLRVLATDVGGIHEVVETPAHGRLLPRGDSAAYAAALGAMLNAGHDRQMTAELGAPFSWANAARAYDQVLCSAFSDRETGDGRG